MPDYRIYEIRQDGSPALAAHPKIRMTSETPGSVAEHRLSIARRLYEALVTQHPNKAITLRDGGGIIVARHSPRPQQGESEPRTVRRQWCGCETLSALKQ
jgi:hypothetical protein